MGGEAPGSADLGEAVVAGKFMLGAAGTAVVGSTSGPLSMGGPAGEMRSSTVTLPESETAALIEVFWPSTVTVLKESELSAEAGLGDGMGVFLAEGGPSL